MRAAQAARSERGAIFLRLAGMISVLTNLSRRCVCAQVAARDPKGTLRGDLARLGVKRENGEMNDPHVVSLTYRIEKAKTVDFDKAPPLAVDCGSFRVTIDDYVAKVEMVDHFASVDEARNAVWPFLRAWELDAALRAPDERFRFVYETAEVFDPNQARAAVGAAAAAGAAFAASHTSRDKWPDPPQDLEVSANADAMWRRWRGFREKREKLTAAAYWALTMLEAAPGAAAPLPTPRRTSKKRQAAAGFFNIDLDVLNKIGELTSERGGENEERKAGTTPLSRDERKWLEAAFQALVRRVAEEAYAGGPPPKPFKMSDLPKLTPSRSPQMWSCAPRIYDGQSSSMVSPSSPPVQR